MRNQAITGLPIKYSIEYGYIFRIICLLLSLVIISFFQAFNPKGLLFLTLFGALGLVIYLTGIRFRPRTPNNTSKAQEKQFNDEEATHWGLFIFVHSHHSKNQRETGHEFKIANKYFCTGCFGILIGSLIAISFTLMYIFFGINSELGFLAILTTPICFVPITLRYTYYPQMKTPMRLFTNILLPVGCGLLFVSCDYLFQSWFVNFGLILYILMVTFLRASAGNNNDDEGGHFMGCCRTTRGEPIRCCGSSDDIL